MGCLAKGDIFFWQNILKNRSKYRGDISEQSVVCTVLISAIIIEIFRKNIPISYIIPYKKLASPLIPVCLKKSHMSRHSVGLDIWFLVGPFVYFHTSCVRTAKAAETPPEPSLVAYVISTIISWADSNGDVITFENCIMQNTRSPDILLLLLHSWKWIMS